MRFTKLILILFLLFDLKEIKAQLYLNDATFSLSAVDDFTGTAINTSSWCPDLCFTNQGGEVIFDPANIIVSGGWLKFKCEDLRAAPVTSNSVQWGFRSGAIHSANPYKYKYGYWEMSAKLPVGEGIYPSFWTLGSSSSPLSYNEIDIMENLGLTSTTGTLMEMHYHWGPGVNSNVADPITNPAPVSNIANEHKYAVFWEPNRVTWYFDDREVGTLDITGTSPAIPCGTILGLDVDSITTGSVNTTFPSYFEINYFKISQLIPDCNTVENICNFNAGTYSYKVKQSISIGGSSCTSSINTSSNVSLWATDFILLDEGTTITDNGSGSFLAKTILCPN